MVGRDGAGGSTLDTTFLKYLSGHSRNFEHKILVPSQIVFRTIRLWRRINVCTKGSAYFEKMFDKLDTYH